MLRTLFFLLLTGFSTVFFAQSTEKTPMKGLLWEISGNGSKKPSYLYGTMHVSEKLAFNLSDTFFRALRAVDYVALETDCEKWQEFQKTLADFREEMGGGGRRYYDDYAGGPNLYNDMFIFESPENELLGAMLSFKPYLSNEFLYRSDDNEDYEENTYLDLFIHQAGKKLGKKVIGLETVEGSYEMATKAQLPPSEEEEEVRYNRGYVSRTQFEDAYRDQDLNLMDSLDQLLTPGKHYRKWMLDERNHVHANGIDSVIRMGHNIFAAVGAAHLPGDQGVISLLRKKGYSMRPVVFNGADVAKEKEKIDKIHYPVTISRQWAPDSSWSVEAPGKFYTTLENNGGFSQNLYADMSNGVYYAVYKVNTYGFWTGQDAEYVKSRIDSMIYERIPGKIQERKALDAPYQGHEITTRTTRGDILRYKIFITPFEVALFVTGGNSDYALGEEATRFINSVTLTKYNAEAKPITTELRPKHGGFKAVFPATLQVNTTDDKEAEQFLAATQNPSDKAVYFLMRGELHDHDFIEEDSFELNIIGEKIAEAFTKNKPQVRLVANNTYPTQECWFKAELGRVQASNAWVHLKIVIDGPSYYLLGCRKANEERPNLFFDGFAITKAEFPEGWVEKQDTTLRFKVMQPLKAEKTPPPYIGRIKKMFKEAAERREDRYGGGSDYTERFGSTELTGTLTGEEVNVYMHKLNAAMSYPSLDSLKKSAVDKVSRRKKQLLKSQNWQEKNGMLIADFLVTDTNSTRGIKTRMIFINRKEYSLSTVVNTAEPESDFVQKIFATFQPTDSITGEKVYASRSLDFLNDIYAADSLKRKKALKELDNTWAGSYQKEDFEPLRAAIEHPDFGKLKFKDRKELINALSSTKSEKSGAWLTDFYDKWPDSIRYRLLAVNGLINCTTQKDYESLLRIVLENPVITNDYGNPFAEKVSDSLELVAATLMPKLMQLHDMERWTDDVFNLCYLLYKKNLIKPKIWAPYKDVLLKNARVYLISHRESVENEREQKAERYYYGNNTLRSDLRQYLQLLAPFLKKDKAVKALMDDALRYGSEELQVAVYGIYLKNGLNVPESALKPFVENRDSHAELFAMLAEAGKLEQYPKAWFSDTTALIQSYFFGASSRNARMDSVRFFKRYPTKKDGQPAWLYFFETKRKKEKDWNLSYTTISPNLAFLHNKEDKALPENLRYRLLNAKKGRYYHGNAVPRMETFSNPDPKQREEFIRKKTTEGRFDGRERYEERSNRYGGYRRNLYDF